ncbi:uncharacterized protein LOC111706142 isoform X3 [Eurytemora carolleeae]|nr:uncharacterized protein LOC111706142 isoform X2 [Eurytemora carolleeae]XP_023334698.1 uncharacterized protein LOC111706142 isoform X3 [Eurytemora carolleeae]|eukprot:XP_023334697.1 uncharacterized protein LOC111706142 isoform X2 [Eurytemora affinis]
MLSLAAIFFCLNLVGFGQGATCECESMLLSSTGGLANEWPIFMNTWILDTVEYDGHPQYRCDECFGARKVLIWLEDRWSIVDCNPDNSEGCQGVHEFVRSPRVPTGTCLWDVQGEWEYCDGEISVSCSH